MSQILYPHRLLAHVWSPHPAFTGLLRRWDAAPVRRFCCTCHRHFRDGELTRPPQGLSLKPPLSADPSSCWHTGGFGQENGLLGLLPASFVPTSLPSNSGRKTLQPAFLLAHSGGHADFRKHLRHEVCNEELLTAPS